MIRASRGRDRADATATASWPVTTTISSTPASDSASIACWASGFPSTTTICFVPPKRDPVPAASTTPEITGLRLGLEPEELAEEVRDDGPDRRDAQADPADGLRDDGRPGRGRCRSGLGRRT